MVEKYGANSFTLESITSSFYLFLSISPWPSSFPHFYVVIYLEGIFTLDIYLFFRSRLSPHLSCSALHFPAPTCLCVSPTVLSHSATPSMMWADMWNMANWRVCCGIIPSDKEINLSFYPLLIHSSTQKHTCCCHVHTKRMKVQFSYKILTVVTG